MVEKYRVTLTPEERTDLEALISLGKADARKAPPEGKKRWTLRLLAERMVELEYTDSVSHEAVRQALKKRDQAPPEADVVHPAEGVGRVRLRHKGRPGRLPSAV